MEQRWCGRGGYTPQNIEHTERERDGQTEREIEMKMML